jgi:hypothetical protein
MTPTRKRLLTRLTPYCLAAVACLHIGFACLNSASGQSLTPSSPEVQRTVDRGIGYLERNSESRLGGKALAGLAALKAGRPLTHPLVREALNGVRKEINRSGQYGADSQDIYSAGLAVCFLVAMDPVGNRPEINAVLQFLYRNQKAHGGWGYGGPGIGPGDMSMTQYGVLAYWESMTSGIQVRQDSAAAALEWIMRVQYKSGCFPYQGDDSGDERPSMAAAGTGSLYIGYDLFGFNGATASGGGGEKLPPALRPADRPIVIVPERLRFNRSFNLGAIRNSQAGGDNWIGKNFTHASDASGKSYMNYALYAWERYWSFRELAENIMDPSPPWYNDGARNLIDSQGSNGSWSRDCGEVPDTSFAILFLMRSSKKSIEQNLGLGEGNMVGGRGLPSDTDRIQVRNGQVISLNDIGEVDRLFDLLENPEDPDFDDRMREMGTLTPSESRELVSTYAAQLRNLAGATSAEARLRVVDALGKSGNIHQAPLLIYALTDPDPEIVIAARNSLRRLSRKLDGFGLPDQPNSVQVKNAIEDWQNWYRAVKPDAEFENY